MVCNFERRTVVSTMPVVESLNCSCAVATILHVNAGPVGILFKTASEMVVGPGDVPDILALMMGEHDVFATAYFILLLIQ